MRYVATRWSSTGNQLAIPSQVAEFIRQQNRVQLRRRVRKKLALGEFPVDLWEVLLGQVTTTALHLRALMFSLSMYAPHASEMVSAGSPVCADDQSRNIMIFDNGGC
jgi:hypothetical protein